MNPKRMARPLPLPPNQACCIKVVNLCVSLCVCLFSLLACQHEDSVVAITMIMNMQILAVFHLEGEESPGISPLTLGEVLSPN